MMPPAPAPTLTNLVTPRRPCPPCHPCPPPLLLARSSCISVGGLSAADGAYSLGCGIPRPPQHTRSTTHPPTYSHPACPPVLGLPVLVLAHRQHVQPHTRVLVRGTGQELKHLQRSRPAPVCVVRTGGQVRSGTRRKRSVDRVACGAHATSRTLHGTLRARRAPHMGAHALPPMHGPAGPAPTHACPPRDCFLTRLFPYGIGSTLTPPKSQPPPPRLPAPPPPC